MKLTSRRKFLGIVLLSTAATLFHKAANASVVGGELDSEAQEHFKAMLGKAANVDDQFTEQVDDNVSFADSNSEDEENYQATSDDGEDYQAASDYAGYEGDFAPAGFDDSSYNQADFYGQEEDF